MKVENIEWVSREGYPLLKCTIDGIEAVIGTEHKRKLGDHKIVYLGSRFKATHFVKVPPAIADLLGVDQLAGYTDDPDFWDNVLMPFLESTMNGTFKPQKFSESMIDG